MYDDEFCANSFYAAAGLTDLQEFNQMEAVFLKLISYSLFVKHDQFVNS